MYETTPTRAEPMTNETSPEKRLTLEELNGFLELSLACAEQAYGKRSIFGTLFLYRGTC
jgi:hypothetical protein